MPVNILRIEGTDKTGTLVPGLHLPMERWTGTSDVDILPVPQPQEPSGVRTPRSVSGRLVIRVPNAPRYLIAPHGAVYGCVLVGNGTVTNVDVTDVQGSCIHGPVVTHADPTGVVTMDYHSLSSSTEQDLPFRTLDISSRVQTFDQLADYDAYAVDNWDGYDALPITPETLHAARSILKSLPKTFGDSVCSPGADGSIVFEWLKDDGPLRKLFIDIGPGRTWKAYWRLANGKIGTIPRKRITISTIPQLQELFETLLHG
jgi:hypothetical protein